MPFGVVPRQYIKIEDDFLLFVDYPIIQQNRRGKSITIHIHGDKDMCCNLKILRLGDRKINMKVFQDKDIVDAFNESAQVHEYRISGQAVIKVQW